MSTLVRRTENGLEEWVQDWTFAGKMFWEWRVIPEYRLRPHTPSILDVDFFRDLVAKARAEGREVFVATDWVYVWGDNRIDGWQYDYRGNHKSYPHAECEDGRLVWLEDVKDGMCEGLRVIFPVPA
jgi:hypothetical protein